ncbi:LamG-like jellyroll fold domain-containing protein [Nocardioides sp. YIM 152588]|uniref:LamG-like jellyroll fold domain-containing protein n=1 Tax=Nocardioides sp. YIM 152588 TaxID=3158259 RepID=UPI0032E459B8
MKRPPLVGTLAGALILIGVTLAAPASPASAAPETEVSWEMNESSGATTMTDSGPFGIDATVDPSGVRTGRTDGATTFYRWPWRNPTAAPASPERVIQVADDPHLDPGADVFTVELRFRTHANFGNITQKGQSRTPGGQWKIQNPNGRPSCLFKGSNGRTATRSPIVLSDDEWHVLRCVRTTSRVEIWVDGVRVNRKNGWAGTIDNSFPLSIGGKTKCDQIKVTCDYFSGDIDYLRIYRG